MQKIMYICTGNTCRSAMAEGILKKYAQEKKLDIEVYSSGLFAQNGEKASTLAIEAVKKYNVNIENHKATNTKTSNIEEMDIILCATIGHKQMLLQMYPNLKEKTYTMKEFIGEKDQDISDPWGSSIETYEKCADEIEKTVQKTMSMIFKNVPKFFKH